MPLNHLRADRAIILGIDGLDPRICEKMMDAGDLPNFERLRRDGSFSRLRTSTPPQSPVAWSCIASGCNPGKHGIFDFIRRDAKSYLPALSLLRPNPSPLRGRDSMFLPARSGPSFWKVASEKKVPASVIRWPTTFPPEEVNGRMLSGLGVPDLRGNLGWYTFYTTGTLPPDDEAPERVIRVSWNDDRIETALQGPMRSGIGGRSFSELPLELRRSASEIIIQLGGADPIRLRPGSWSEWLPVVFPTGLMSKVSGMVRLCLVEIEPHLKLYVTALEIDPCKPAFPITHPAGYADDLAKEIGRFYTLGMPEDSQAVTHGRIPMETFLEQCEQITVERERMFDYELSRFEEGILAFVFDTSDRIQHMTWFAGDPQHAAYTEADAKRFGQVIPDHYKRMDVVVGKALEKADHRTLLMVLSDHGFGPVRRLFHLNSWFHRNGYLALDGADAGGKVAFENVDWSRTKAYALGFCMVYLNLKGREGNGVVDPDEAESILEKIRRELCDLRDPDSGDRVVRNVYTAAKVYQGPCTEDRPDLVVGYAPGYRPSTPTAMGAAPPGPVIVDNKDLWSGGHLMDPSVVPGSLFINREPKSVRPTQLDIAPTVLSCLGVEPPPEMDGRSII